MCGIAGIFNLREAPVDPAHLTRMIGTIAHRGPDARGVWSEGPIGLAHARLSIIDLSGGAQPMSTRDASLCVTFNGEIFNYVELREELIKKGRRFATQSDTEVILHQYEEEGDACVRSFNGQWAFALWDGRRRRLLLSRDRLGVRPLYYATVGSTVFFGSEVKALFAHPDVPRRIDPRALDQVFTFWAPVAPRTAFEGVFELPPGCSAVIDERGVRVTPYWRLEYPLQVEPMKEGECAERLLELLTDAVRIRLRSDVPVGAYLSGGLDSSVVTALVRGVSAAPLRTFSVAFESAEFDESGYQNEVVRWLGVEHDSIQCRDEDVARVFPDVVWHAEKPLLRTSPAPLYLLAQRVRDAGFKVVLTGEGSDEMLGGYDIFKEAKIRRFWASQPASRRRPLLLRRLYPYLEDIQRQSDAYLQAFFHVRDQDRASPWFSHLPRWELTARIKAFLSEEVKVGLGDHDACDVLAEELPDAFGRWDPFHRAQYLEATYLLPGFILSSQGDRMAMAHGVEGRFPFLDHRVVEFAARIPPTMKMKVLNEKYILKRAVAGLVPPSVLSRPKQPYRAPDIPSFFGAHPAPYLDQYLSERAVRDAGLFDPGRVTQLVAKCRRGLRQGYREQMALVGILSTQILYEQFIRQAPPSVPPV
jgi:asparagine synthase (glutamine-hydrolysing)